MNASSRDSLSRDDLGDDYYSVLGLVSILDDECFDCVFFLRRRRRFSV